MRGLKALFAATCSVLSAMHPAHSESLFRGAITEDAGDFRGLYAGANVGYGFGSASFAAFPSDAAELEGVAGGGHFGFSHRIERMIFGLEADYDAAAISVEESSGGVTASIEASWLASIRGRFGVISDDTLIYGTAGVAWAGMELSASIMGVTASVSDTLTGFVVGGGVEHKFGPRLTGRIELLHYDFSGQEFEAAGTAIGYDADFTVIRTGVSYHVN